MRCILALFLLSAFTFPATATDYKCPNKIVGISDNLFSSKVLEITSKIYAELECQTDFVMMPGKRGTAAFVNGNVDGEIFRIPLIEKKYSKIGFVRSSTPLMTFEKIKVTSIQDSSRKQDAPIGYQLGIQWQMDYVKDKSALSFNTLEELITSYTERKISYFLTTRHSLDAFIEKKMIDPSSIDVMIIDQNPLYHYLKPKYSEFMKAFSAYLEEMNPFADFKL